MLNGQGVVVVDEDDEFLNEAKALFEGRVPTLSSLADAQRTVEETEVDVVILGPSHAHEEALRDAAALLEIDPELGVVLVAASITAPLLKAALRAGLTDVIEAPLEMDKRTEARERFGCRQRRRSRTQASPRRAP
jgi:DNA-binding NtrC family response regulator